MNKVTFTSKDGLMLTGIWHIPTDNTSKAIILAHGITVDKDEKGVFIHLANALQQQGYAVFRFDFRGHGESAGKSTDMSVTGEIMDLEASLQEATSKGYGDIGLVGASFGGGSSALYTSQHQRDIKCLCLWNPVLNYDHTFLNPTLSWLREAKEHMMKDIQKKGWTTLGSINYKIGKPLFDDMATLQPFMALKKITIPTMIIHGTKDMKVPYDDSKEYVVFLVNGKLITLPGADHGFHQIYAMDKAIDATVTFFQKNL